MQLPKTCCCILFAINLALPTFLARFPLVMHLPRFIDHPAARILLASPLIASLQAATITDGHVDIIGIGYEGGELEPHTHVEFGTIDGVTFPDNGVGYEYEPGELTFLVPGSTLSNRLPGSQWDPVGIDAGESYYFLSQSSTQADTLGSIFAGIGTEELAPADWSTPISVTLTGKTGPGEFALAQIILGTPTFHMSTSDGISSADVWAQNADEHEHFNWYFTEVGDYSLTFEFAGTHETDGLRTASATYNFSVVPEPSTALLGALGALGLLRRRR